MRSAVCDTSVRPSIRSGRATPSLLSKITIDYYGTQTPLNQVANLSVPEARLLVISPYDKGSIKAIEKAIQHSDLGTGARAVITTLDGRVVKTIRPAAGASNTPVDVAGLPAGMYIVRIDNGNGKTETTTFIKQ